MSAELGQVVEKTTIHGQVEIATYPWTPDLEGLDDHEVFRLLQDREAHERAQAPNILCVAGLNVLIQAINWAAIQDQNQNMGDLFPTSGVSNPYVMTPASGSVGNGVGVPADTDIGLFGPLWWVPIIGAGLTNASAGNDGFISWSFLFPTAGSLDYPDGAVVTEAGVALIGLPGYGITEIVGQLLNHSVLSSSVVWGATELLTLVVTFGFGNY